MVVDDSKESRSFGSIQSSKQRGAAQVFPKWWPSIGTSARVRFLTAPLRALSPTGLFTAIGGIAVHAAARVMAQSQPSEVLVSRVVTDLVAGAGLKFAERGSHELKGLPG